MIVVSNDFKEAMKQPVKELKAVIDAGDIDPISSDGDLISFKISGDGGLCKSAMRKLEAKYLGEHNLIGKWVTAGFSVKLASGAYEKLNYGSFLVSEQTVTKDTGVTDIVAYDKMINAMAPYVKLADVVEIEYPIGLYDYTKALCKACDLELANVRFGKNLLRNITDYNWEINVGGAVEAGENYIKITMPETPTQYCGTFSSAIKTSSTDIVGKKVIYSFYAKADAERSILVSSAGKEGFHYINLTTEWQRFSFVVESFNLYSPTFYCGNTLNTAPYYIKDIMLEETDALTEYKAFNAMNDWAVAEELWENINGITYRDIFVQIAQVTGTTCIIHDDMVYFKPLTETDEQLTYANMMKLKLEPLYGEINSVVLSRSQIQGEAVYVKDDASIDLNGLTEFVIESNEFVDKDRENAIVPIADQLLGISFFPFETTTEGLGWYEIGDCFTIKNDKDEPFPTALFNFSITIDGGIKETLKTAVESKAQTQYQFAKSIAKRVKNAEILVNKQEQYIQSIVSDIEGANKTYTQIYQDINHIEQMVQSGGGNNLLKNSVMFAYDNDRKPHDWTVENDGLTMQSDADSLRYGGVSGHSFTLYNNTVSQKVSVKASNEKEPSSYTFSCRIKKGIFGECTVTIDDGVEAKSVSLVEGEEHQYVERTISIQPKTNYCTVIITASGDNGVTFTDCMFTNGDYKSKWTQANGEVMNTQVNVSLDGVLVRSSQYVGDYTIMSPLEFAGYSNINGTPTKVFSLNKDVTFVKKLEAEDEMKMPPIKIVPITEGDRKGWAFVPCD